MRSKFAAAGILQQPNEKKKQIFYQYIWVCVCIRRQLRQQAQRGNNDLCIVKSTAIRFDGDHVFNYSKRLQSVKKLKCAKKFVDKRKCSEVKGSKECAACEQILENNKCSRAPTAPRRRGAIIALACHALRVQSRFCCTHFCKQQQTARNSSEDKQLHGWARRTTVFRL